MFSGQWLGSCQIRGGGGERGEGIREEHDTSQARADCAVVTSIPPHVPVCTQCVDVSFTARVQWRLARGLRSLAFPWGPGCNVSLDGHPTAGRGIGQCTKPLSELAVLRASCAAVPSVPSARKGHRDVAERC